MNQFGSGSERAVVCVNDILRKIFNEFKVLCVSVTPRKACDLKGINERNAVNLKFTQSKVYI